jgi:hypothetical protein
VAQAHIGGDLMRAAEAWSRGGGYGELASDTEAHNELNRTVHAGLGFVEVETLVVFRKQLQDGQAQSMSRRHLAPGVLS